MSLSIRRLTEADFESADAILRSAFGSPDRRAADLDLYRHIEPEGLWLASRGGQPAGMVGAVNYGAFAHVGFMAVHETFQRQGIGLALMRHVLSTLERQGVPLIMLDASDAGRPMYQKLGFTAFDPTQIFTCEHLPAGECPPEVRPVTLADLPTLAEWDRAIFGADRGKVLRALLAAYPGRAFMRREAGGRIAGYVFAQGSRIGPWVAAESAEAASSSAAPHAPEAEVLLRAAMSLPFTGAVSVAVPGLNPEAGELLRRYQFEPVRTNRHMGKGASQPPSQRRQIYGQTSLFFG